MGGPGYPIPTQGRWVVKHGAQRQALHARARLMHVAFPNLVHQVQIPRDPKSSRIRLLSLKAKVQQICIDCLLHPMHVLGRHWSCYS